MSQRRRDRLYSSRRADRLQRIDPTARLVSSIDQAPAGRAIGGAVGHGILWIVQTVFEAAGGAEALLRLAGAWHARVMDDEVVSHAFSHGFHPDHVQRLAAYWAEALGGPASYSTSFGDETAVVRIHSGNGPHEEMDRRAVACFDQALDRRWPGRR